MMGSGWTGATALYAGHYGSSGTGQYGPDEHLQPSAWPGLMGEDYRRCCTSSAWIGEALAARLVPGMQSAWNHAPFFAYADRWMTEDDTQAIATIKAQRGKDYSGFKQRKAWDAFVTTCGRRTEDEGPDCRSGASRGTRTDGRGWRGRRRRGPTGTTAKVPSALWGVELDARAAGAIGVERLRELRKAGINAVVVQSGRAPARTLAGLRRRAARASLIVLVPRTVRSKGIRSGERRAQCVPRGRPLRRGGLFGRGRAASFADGRRRSVAVRVRGAGAAARLQRTTARRLLILARLVPNPRRMPPRGVRRSALRVRAPGSTSPSARSEPALARRWTPISRSWRSAGRRLRHHRARLRRRAGTQWPPRRPAIPDRPASVWVSTAGNDGTCARLDQSKPCKTVNRAYRVAQPGDQVELAAGSIRRRRPR